VGEANRRLAPSFDGKEILSFDHRFYQDLGVDLDALGVIYDIKDRANKSPLAYTDFLQRGRYVNGEWQKTIARVVGRYETGGLGSLNELVHEKRPRRAHQRDPQPSRIHRLARHAFHRSFRRRPRRGASTNPPGSRNISALRCPSACRSRACTAA
jgi:hypothetical protein